MIQHSKGFRQNGILSLFLQILFKNTINYFQMGTFWGFCWLFYWFSRADYLMLQKVLKLRLSGWWILIAPLQIHHQENYFLKCQLVEKGITSNKIKLKPILPVKLLPWHCFQWHETTKMGARQLSKKTRTYLSSFLTPQE